MTTIHIRHAKKIGLCSAGMRQFAMQLGLDWFAFVTTGIDVEEVRHIDDAFMQKVIAIAEQEESEASNG